MFEQEQDVTDFSLFAQGYELLLQAQARGVIDGAELYDGDQIRFATDLCRFARSKNLSPQRHRVTEKNQHAIFSVSV